MALLSDATHDVELWIHLDGDWDQSLYHIEFDMVGYPCSNHPGYETYEPEIGDVFLCDGEGDDDEGVEISGMLTDADDEKIREAVREYMRDPMDDCSPEPDFYHYDGDA